MKFQTMKKMLNLCGKLKLKQQPNGIAINGTTSILYDTFPSVLASFSVGNDVIQVDLKPYEVEKLLEALDWELVLSDEDLITVREHLQKQLDEVKEFLANLPDKIISVKWPIAKDTSGVSPGIPIEIAVSTSGVVANPTSCETTITEIPIGTYTE